MRAVHIAAFSASLENLKIEMVPDPIPRDGEAKVKILAASAGVAGLSPSIRPITLPRVAGALE